MNISRTSWPGIWPFTCRSMAQSASLRNAGIAGWIDYLNTWALFHTFGILNHTLVVQKRFMKLQRKPKDLRSNHGIFGCCNSGAESAPQAMQCDSTHTVTSPTLARLLAAQGDTSKETAFWLFLSAFTIFSMFSLKFKVYWVYCIQHWSNISCPASEPNWIYNT